MQSRPSRRFDELERQFHPEWGFLVPRRSFLGTFRVVVIASAIGALSGGGTVLWVKGGAPDATESVAARTLVPPEVEARGKLSEATSSGLPPQRQIPLEASEPNTPQTSFASREGETSGPEADANLPARQPNAVQGETIEPRDHAPGGGDVELGAVGSKSRQAPNIAPSPPPVHAKSPQMTGRVASELEPVRKKVKPEVVERRSNQRDARNSDV